MAKINALDSQISKLTEVFIIDLHIDTSKRVSAMNTLLTSLHEPMKRLVDDSSISKRNLRETQHLELLHSLSLVPFSNHHKRYSEGRMSVSGQWLLSHDRYLNWRNTSSSCIFLLYGIMGSGKTTLTLAAPFAYFYCTKNLAENERSDPDEIMRSVLRQLTFSHGSPSTIHERVLQEYQRRQMVAKVDGIEATRLQTAECVRLILEITAANPAAIVFDALDEIPCSSTHILLSAFNQILQESLNVVKIFVTSRDDSNIQALLPDSVALRIQDVHTRKDMDGFIRQEVSSAIDTRKLLNGIVSDNLKEELVDVLKAGAREM